MSLVTVSAEVHVGVVRFGSVVTSVCILHVCSMAVGKCRQVKCASVDVTVFAYLSCAVDGAVHYHVKREMIQSDGS